ncbi:hypothetical protein FBEOM_8963 [Fusarium beomiforme]|uniref:CBM-cenC domain-containing protein n=1 Tax=Fusarium beomiforme TaxID=44412 RepID=A0A9P5AEC5_9HYPO|nr:hypothetical protein FBEOM_8963 [Fusarium beomiforme]
MRWVSIAAILGAALLPASARPLCRPDRSTTTGLPSTTATATSVETLSTDTATATTDFTTVTSAATSEATTIAEVTTTTTEAPEATNYIQNGDFEDTPNTDWSLRTGDIKTNPARAKSGDQYVQYDVNDAEAVGGNQLNQTINGLSTERLYRLTAYYTVFDIPAPVKESSTVCVIQALADSSVVGNWFLDFTNLNTYAPNHADFTPADEDVTVTLRLRCSAGKKVTLSVGLDDVSLYDIGPRLVG